MKRLHKLYTLLLSSVLLFSCSEDDLKSESVFTDLQGEKNQLDNYIVDTYTQDYNIAILYKFIEGQSDLNYNLSPASYESSVRMTKLMYYLGIEPYDKITGGKDFIKSYFPKVLNYIGSPAYRNNGTMVLGTAEGGAKITMYNLNALNEDRSTDIEYLNFFYFHTIHHEFAHILHQTRDFPTSFDQISGNGYVSDAWSDVYDDETAVEEGFVSAYASKSAHEDFVETYSFYITLTPEQWEERTTSGGEDGKVIIENKLDIVRTYFLSIWKIDLDELRAEILSRQENLPNFDQISLD